MAGIVNKMKDAVKKATSKKAEKTKPKKTLSASQEVQISAIEGQGKRFKSNLHALGATNPDDGLFANETLAEAAELVDEAVTLVIQHIDPDGVYEDRQKAKTEPKKKGN